jgi:hypothetical protein
MTEHDNKALENLEAPKEQADLADPFGGEVVEGFRSRPSIEAPTTHVVFSEAALQSRSVTEDSTTSEEDLEGSGIFPKLPPKTSNTEQPTDPAQTQEAANKELQALLEQTLTLHKKQQTSQRTIVTAMLGSAVLVLCGLVAILWAAGVFEKPSQELQASVPLNESAQTSPAAAPAPTKTVVTAIPAPSEAASPDVTPLAAKTPSIKPATPVETPKTPSNAPTESSAAPLVAPKNSSCRDLGLCPEPEKPAAPPLTPPTAPEEPQVATTLSQDQIKKVLAGANLKPCKTVGTGKVNLKITVASSGKVTSVQSDGTPVGDCAAAVVKKLSFPTFSAPSQTFSQAVFVKD